jgi:hypothetical protein
MTVSLDKPAQVTRETQVYQLHIKGTYELALTQISNYLPVQAIVRRPHLEDTGTVILDVTFTRADASWFNEALLNIWMADDQRASASGPGRLKPGSLLFWQPLHQEPEQIWVDTRNGNWGYTDEIRVVSLPVGAETDIDRHLKESDNSVIILFGLEKGRPVQ